VVGVIIPNSQSVLSLPLPKVNKICYYRPFWFISWTASVIVTRDELLNILSISQPIVERGGASLGTISTRNVRLLWLRRGLGSKLFVIVVVAACSDVSRSLHFNRCRLTRCRYVQLWDCQSENLIQFKTCHNYCAWLCIQILF